MSRLTQNAEDTSQRGSDMPDGAGTRSTTRTLDAGTAGVVPNAYRDKDPNRPVTMAGSGSETGYSATSAPEPPRSAGKSFILGSPSRMGSTVSA